MTLNDFIFSNLPANRLTRHLVFWLVFGMHVLFFRYYLYDLKYVFYLSTYLIRLRNLLLFLPVSIFCAYFSMYYLLPVFILKGRYLQLLLIAMTLCVLFLLISYFISTVLNIRLAWDIPLNRQPLVRQVDFTVSNGLVYPLTVSTFAIGIKMGKNFYLQQKENELLKQQKLIKEVQLLKAQIHPRFLFRSLNAVYEDTLKQFNKSPALLLKLSDLLSYILYESNDEKVLLQKELDMVENYLALEKLNLGNDIQIIIDRNVNAKESGIAPLILLPILEIVFEQDIIAQSRQLVLNISMNGNDLLFILELNTLQEIKEISFQDDESMVQVQKRLQALYPARHSFTFKIQEKFNIIFSLSLRVADETGEEKVANHLKALA